MKTRFTRISRTFNSAGIAALMMTVGLPAIGAPRPKSPSERVNAQLSTLASRFEEPLIATAPTTAKENAALLAALKDYEARSTTDDFAALQSFLADYPRSGWRIALLTNLGLSYYHYGYFSKAIETWTQAWEAGRSITEPRSKALVDRALGELMRMHARLGHADELEGFFKDVADRPITGPATEALTGAKEGLWLMQHEPGFAFLCGPKALKNLLLSEGLSQRQLQFLEKARSGSEGVSLAEVARLADQAKLSYRLIFRETDQTVPVPSIVHWKVRHFAAIVGVSNGRFHIQDPTFGNDLWVSRAALDAEASGYFLVPHEAASANWRNVSAEEAGHIRGMGNTTAFKKGTSQSTALMAHGCDGGDSGCPKSTLSTTAATMPLGCAHAMCVYNITLTTVSVNLKDTPVGYTPPKGPDVHVTLTYNQREDSQPATFGWFNVSPKWTLNWLSYIEDDPGLAGSNVMRYVAGGGSISYTGFNRTAPNAFAPEERDASVLLQTSTMPIAYERRLLDGSREVYTQSNGATSYPRRVFLSQVVDPSGNSVALSYDSQLRLVSLTDATGRLTTFSYALSAQPLLVTAITDPFGRNAQLAYDANGRLRQITDTLGLVSQFVYDASGLVNSLVTPYGTNQFTYGQDGITRFVTATDPLGNTERVEFLHQAPGIAGADPANTIPAVTDPFPGFLSNQFLYYRNTFYWDKHSYAVAAGNYTLARITHWHHWTPDTNQTADSVESIKLPFENRVWFTYPNQAFSDNSAPFDGPHTISRVLDDGTSQITTLSYNDLGNVNDAIDPLGRETQSVFDANNIDVLQVKQKTSASGFSTIAQFTYNAQHLPLTSTDAAGQTTSYAYNAAGQITQVTNALNQVTRYEYDGLGYLTRVVNPNNQTAASFTYDGFGHIATRTDSEGYTVKFDYDALDRVTKETYPDATTREYTYNRLDLASVKDRQGRTTQYSYDAVRNLIAITDPLGRQTKLAYYENNQLKSLTDANNNTTAWDIDLENRVTAKHYADGKQTVNAYEATTSRLKSTTDALSQIKQYSYTLDDQLAGIAYANAINPTPNVSFSYDPFFQRKVSMTDGSGTTQYSYRAIGSLGALQLAQEDGAYSNDTIGHQYDALGRVVGRTVDTSTETFGFDNLGRPTSHASALGSFDMSYLGQTGQLTGRHIHGGTLGTDWAFDTNANDRRLKSIANSGASRGYQFTITPENIISKIAETAPAGAAFPPQTWNYTYDSADRLLHGTASGGAHYDYGYDPADNITSVQGPTGNQAASYNAVNQITGFGSQSYVYDANGNVLDDGIRTYKWDAEDRLVNVVLKAQPARTTAYRYDGLGRRIAIVTNGVETRYLWCGDALCQARTSSDAVTRRYFPEGEVVPAGGTLLYYGRDQLGSVRDVLAVQNGSRVAAFEYDPYGNPTQTSGRVSTDFRYAGMFYDQQDGLYLTNYRIYDPKTGRWLSRDPIGEDGGTNLYGYIDASPLNGYDILGLSGTSVPQADHSSPPPGCSRLDCFWYHGNWGGPGWSGGQWQPLESLTVEERARLAKPVDAEDTCYMEHDYCYSRSRVGGSCTPNDKTITQQHYQQDQVTGQCDKELAQCLWNLGNTSTLNPSASRAQVFFKVRWLLKSTERQP